MNTKVLRREMKKRAASMDRIKDMLMSPPGTYPTTGEQVRGYRAKKAKRGVSYKPPVVTA